MTSGFFGPAKAVLNGRLPATTAAAMGAKPASSTRTSLRVNPPVSDRLASSKAKSRLEEAAWGTEDWRETLRQRWKENILDLTGPIPAVLPPMRAVNHSIPLIDEKRKVRYRTPRCPDYLHKEFMEKIDRYVAAGWWEPRSADSASPLLCIPKLGTTRLRTALDAWDRNSNMVKDLTPFPDQDLIRQTVAAAPFRSKLNMSDAYEQIWVVPEDVGKTAFVTICGTYVSHTMQIGDCNAP